MIVWSTSGFQLFVIRAFSLFVQCPFDPHSSTSFFSLMMVAFDAHNLAILFCLQQFCDLWNDGAPFQHHLLVQQDPSFHQGAGKRHLLARFSRLLSPVFCPPLRILASPPPCCIKDTPSHPHPHTLTLTPPTPPHPFFCCPGRSRLHSIWVVPLLECGA